MALCIRSMSLTDGWPSRFMQLGYLRLLYKLIRLPPQIPGHDIYDAIHVCDNVGEEWPLEELLAHKAFISTCMVKVSFCLLQVNRSNPIAQPEACRSWTVRSSCTMTPTHRSCWCSTGTKRSSRSRSCFRGAAKNGFTPKRDEMALHLFFLIKAL